MSDEIEMTEETTHTRRRVLRGAIGGVGVALSVSGGLAVERVLATGGDDDDDDDRDNSGSGSGGDDDHNDHDNSGPGSGDDDENDAVEVTGEIPESSIEIRIVNDDSDGFQPGDLTVDVGQSVTFVNAHDDVHTATGSGFDTDDIPPGATATIVLEEPGRFSYACNYHPEMAGTISVRDAQGNVPEQAAQEDVPADATEVQIINFAFDPATVTVPVGGTIVWINNDSAPHTATALDRSFDSNVLDPGMSFSWQFTKPGSIPYRCSLHPAMEAMIEVTGEAAGGGEDAATEAAPGGSVVGAWVVTLEPDADAGLAPQRALVTFHEDGTIDATFAALGDGTDGLGFRLSEAHGSWQEAGNGGFAATIAAFLLDDDQQFAGMLTITEEGQLEEDGDSYIGTVTFEATNLDGGSLASGEGTTEGVRVISGRATDAATPEPVTIEVDATPFEDEAEPTTTTVTIIDFVFDPAEVEVVAGTTVTWVNEDAVPHTATADDGSFDTGRLDQGQDGSATFDQPGTYAYHCDFHPDMVGTVRVT